MGQWSKGPIWQKWFNKSWHINTRGEGWVSPVQWMVHKCSDISVSTGNVKSSLFKESYPFVSGSQPRAEVQVCMCVKGEEQQEHRTQILR